MRLWSFHPKYLDNVGLSRAINEGVSGYKALTGKQKMWKNHPQLTRFKDYGETQLKLYIEHLLIHFYNRKCISIKLSPQPFNVFVKDVIEVTTGQLIYEWNHYLNKLEKRNNDLYQELMHITCPEPHPLLEVVEGDIESWEKVRSKLGEDKMKINEKALACDMMCSHCGEWASYTFLAQRIKLCEKCYKEMMKDDNRNL
jgi:hypothetical protein